MFERVRMGDAREGVASFLEKRNPIFTDSVMADYQTFAPWDDDGGYR